MTRTLSPDSILDSITKELYAFSKNYKNQLLTTLLMCITGYEGYEVDMRHAWAT